MGTLGQWRRKMASKISMRMTTRISRTRPAEPRPGRTSPGTPCATQTRQLTQPVRRPDRMTASSPRRGRHMAVSFDAIIIGAGHNGLVTACYLAKAGKKVLVLERRHVVGGACVTEEVFPGFKVSTAAYVNSLFRKEIVADLRLKEYGFEVLERNPSSFSPFPDGRYLLLGPDAGLNTPETSK